MDGAAPNVVAPLIVMQGLGDGKMAGQLTQGLAVPGHPNQPTPTPVRSSDFYS